MDYIDEPDIVTRVTFFIVFIKGGRGIKFRKEDTTMEAETRE